MDSLTKALASDLDAAFERLVVAHQDRVYGLALRSLRTPAAAEDAAQETFLRAYRALSGYDAVRIRALQVRPWLVTIALNVCRNTVRRQPPGALMVEPPATDDPAGQAVDRDALARIEKRLDAMEPRQREAFLLLRVADLTYAEAAVVLEAPVGTVKAWVHRATEQLRKELT